MIEFVDVGFSYGKKIIFNNLNFKIHRNDLIYIEGQNGIGKTTFLKLILGLLEPQTGKINKDQNLVISWSPATDLSFFPRLTGKENLEIFCKIGNIQYKKPNILDNALGEEILSLPFFKLSSGMKQLLLLARANLKKSDLIILDEPLRGLDHTHQELIHSFIQNEHKQGRAIIFTSHIPIVKELPGLQTRKVLAYAIN